MKQTVLQQAEYADEAVNISPRQPQPVTVDALSSYQAEDLVHERWMVDRDGEVDMARMARARLGTQVAGGTSTEVKQWVSIS